VEAGKFLDPEKYFIVCANILGSHYGTTGPLSVNPATGKPYYHTFPDFTVRDIVQVHRLLAAHLGISRVELLIGSSLGGFQCMEWALIDPDFARRVALIATTPVSKPWAAAFNESQRMALLADPTFHTDSDTAGQAGLATARSIALLSYRGQQAYDLTQADAGASTDPADPFHRKVHSYQRHQLSPPHSRHRCPRRGSRSPRRNPRLGARHHQSQSACGGYQLRPPLPAFGP
jgi:homoserine O-acetyltransferase